MLGLNRSRLERYATRAVSEVQRLASPDADNIVEATVFSRLEKQMSKRSKKIMGVLLWTELF